MRPEPSIPQCKPSKDKISSTPRMSPPADKESSSRIPPQPQNREMWDKYGSQKPNPEPAPLPNKYKYGTSKEAPARIGGTSDPKPKAPDTTNWNPYNNPSEGADKETGGAKANSFNLPTRPKVSDSKPPSSAPGSSDAAPNTPLKKPIAMAERLRRRP